LPGRITLLENVMSATRLEELLSDIWADVFAIFDREPELTGEDAGAIATAAEDAARRAFLEREAAPPTGRTIEQIATGEKP